MMSLFSIKSFSVKSLFGLVALLLACTVVTSVQAESKSNLDREAQKSLNTLISTVPEAKALNDKAIAVLVFPTITKAGFIVGGQFGEGVLFKGGKPFKYYNTAGASYGLQVGAQQYGYALFFMTDKSLNELDSTKGFEVGVGPSVVVVDQGKGVSTTSITMTHDIYAFIFSQKGLMAGIGIQGNKITRIDK